MLTRRALLRRSTLLGVGIATGGLSVPNVALAQEADLRVVGNPGLENATLNALMSSQGFLRDVGVEVRMIEIPAVAGPFDAIERGEADACMVSGYNMVLPRIARGAPLRIIGAGMRKVALAVYANPDRIRQVADLEGRTVAVGPPMGLLHLLMLQLLDARGTEASRVRFVDKGSNDDGHRAAASGEVDACCSSISHLNDRGPLAVLADGMLWKALPRCTFQLAYASTSAIENRRDDLVRVVAAYGKLYDFLMSPRSHDAFFEARRTARKSFDLTSARAVWDFYQAERPYSRDLSLRDEDIDDLQDAFVRTQTLDRRIPARSLTDPSIAKLAANFLN